MEGKMKTQLRKDTLKIKKQIIKLNLLAGNSPHREVFLPIYNEKNLFYNRK